jgi:hypothetical protein
MGIYGYISMNIFRRAFTNELMTNEPMNKIHGYLWV